LERQRAGYVAHGEVRLQISVLPPYRTARPSVISKRAPRFHRANSLPFEHDCSYRIACCAHPPNGTQSGAPSNSKAAQLSGAEISGFAGDSVPLLS